MASVSSLDKDLRQMRLDKYTPQAANEVRIWIEEVLGDRLAPGDLLEALKDGVALCRWAHIKNIRLEDLTMSFVDSSIMPCPQESSSSSPPCLSCKWKIFPTSCALARCLLSTSLHMMSSSRSIFTKQKTQHKFYNALAPLVVRPTPSIPLHFHERLA